MNRSGYGLIKIHRRVTGAHRAMWTYRFGPIPAGMCVCHRCDNPPCVNPDHLFLGTVQDNNADMVRKGRHRAPTGEATAHAKLTRADVVMMRALLAKGVPQVTCASLFGVSQCSVYDIKRRRFWKAVG
jgi:hypothetical protein